MLPAFVFQMTTYPSPFASTLGAAAANHAAMASYLKATSASTAAASSYMNHHMNGLSALTAGMTSSASSNSSLMDSSHLYGGGSYSKLKYKLTQVFSAALEK